MTQTQTPKYFSVWYQTLELGHVANLGTWRGGTGVAWAEVHKGGELTLFHRLLNFPADFKAILMSLLRSIFNKLSLFAVEASSQSYWDEVMLVSATAIKRQDQYKKVTTIALF